MNVSSSWPGTQVLTGIYMYDDFAQKVHVSVSNITYGTYFVIGIVLISEKSIKVTVPLADPNTTFSP
jgi:hypothetical protein